MISLHANTRVLRFLLVLSAVVLTIFIYASYSSTATLVPPHMRVAGTSNAASLTAALTNPQNVENKSIHKDESRKRFHFNSTGFPENDGSGNSSNRLDHSGVQNKKNKKAAAGRAAYIAVPKKSHHREPTIDVDAVSDVVEDVPDEVALERFVSNDLLEEQYAQNFDTILGGSINNSAMQQPQQQVDETIPNADEEQQKGTRRSPEHIKSQMQEQHRKLIKLAADNNKFSKIPDSDVMIPTSNLQKIIENADKILRNITALPPTIDKSSSKETTTGSKEKKVEQQAAAVDDDVALPPSVVMTIKHGSGPKSTDPVSSKPQNPTVSRKNDSLKGLLAIDIYESGHMNEELNIAKLCPDNGIDIKLLILITSAQAHTEARMAIRQTWAHYGTRRDVSAAFILGHSPNAALNAALSQENFIYGDLIRGNFLDSYNNLTLKTISALEWVDQHCPKAKYILKTDDDMFINVPKLLAFLDNHSKEKRVIYGRLAKKWKPIRNTKSKYYVSTEQFSAPVFPPFTTGPAYVISRDVIHDLYESSLRQVYLKLEDVFTTGIVAQQLGIKRVHVNEFLNRRIAFNPCNIRKTISVHMIKSNEQFDLWKKLLDQTTKCK